MLVRLIVAILSLRRSYAMMPLFEFTLIFPRRDISNNCRRKRKIMNCVYLPLSLDDVRESLDEFEASTSNMLWVVFLVLDGCGSNSPKHFRGRVSYGVKVLLLPWRFLSQCAHQWWRTELHRRGFVGRCHCDMPTVV